METSRKSVNKMNARNWEGRYIFNVARKWAFGVTVVYLKKLHIPSILGTIFKPIPNFIRRLLK